MDITIILQKTVQFLTLVAMELVLGVDNVVFISILSSVLPKNQQKRARVIGLSLAIITRVIALSFISVLANMTSTLFTLFGHGVNMQDIILFLGGLFLLYKSVIEIDAQMHGEHGPKQKASSTFIRVILTIMWMDIVFSLDSIITAIGMVNDLWIMISAVIIAMGVMVAFVNPIAEFVDHNPTIRMLALSFLLLIGVTLISGATGHEINKNYIYFAMGFSVLVEMLNMKVRQNRKESLHV